MNLDGSCACGIVADLAKLGGLLQYDHGCSMKDYEVPVLFIDPLILAPVCRLAGKAKWSGFQTATPLR